MTWHETIEYIRTHPEYAELVNFAYLESNLALNVERFLARPEFQETIAIVEKYAPEAKTILDIGCGNGISTISFAKKGYRVTAVEPDSSNTVGANAIRKLINEYQLNETVEVIESTAEELSYSSADFDVVYIRQSMHHAFDLNKFISNSSRFLKKGGLFLTVRDHVIYNEKDKQWFLHNHPLQKFYGGENAFTSSEYKQAFKLAGLDMVQELNYFDTVINYYPSESPDRIMELKRQKLRNSLGKIVADSFLFELISRAKGWTPNEAKVPGRMYSYICIKE